MTHINHGGMAEFHSLWNRLLQRDFIIIHHNDFINCKIKNEPATAKFSSLVEKKKTETQLKPSELMTRLICRNESRQKKCVRIYMKTIFNFPFPMQRERSISAHIPVPPHQLEVEISDIWKAIFFFFFSTQFVEFFFCVEKTVKMNSLNANENKNHIEHELSHWPV